MIRRGCDCKCQTIAKTSNEKFIPKMSKVYYDKWTDMLVYPGYTGFDYPFQHPYGPYVLKAWDLESHVKNHPCKSCSSQ